MALRGPSGAVHQADWLDFARGLRPASVDLLYADPPFNTGKSRSTPPGAAKAGRTAREEYRDSWRTVRDYIDWLRERVVATMPALKPTGNVLVHVDWRTSHHVRLMLDEVLGEDRFVNHLIWSYGLGGSSPRRFARKHDDILFYCVDPGRYYFEAPMVASTSRMMAGKPKKATDVLAIASINNQAKERCGYPTQKPLELLSMLVGACCPAGGTVLDPCCGSGTTLVAAMEQGRNWLGCDISAGAVRIANGRLEGGRGNIG